jgi:Mrp family chromosome partitioning ATPase
VDKERQEIAIGLRQALRIAVRQGWLVVLCAVVAGAVGYLIATSKDDRYEAHAQMLVQAYSPDLTLPDIPAAFNDPTRARATALQLTTIPEVARRVIVQLHLPLNHGAKVTTSADGDSDVITVKATAPNPVLAANVANAFAQQYIEYRRQTNAERYRQAADVISAKVDRLKRKAKLRAEGKITAPKTAPTDRKAQHRASLETLRAQIDRLHLLADTQTGGAQIVQRANPAVEPVDDHHWRDALLAALAGLVLGLVLVFFRERLRDHIDREDDLADIAPGIPVIGYVPPGRSRRSTGRVADGYHNLAAALMSLRPDGGPRTVLVTSAMAQDGKTSTALNIALDLAQRDANPLYVEADLRRPAVGKVAQLNGSSEGLRAVLAGTQTVEQCVASVQFDESRGRSGAPRVAIPGTLNVLAAGEGKGEPQTLIGDRSATALLSRSREHAGYVIVDGPPLGVVADVLPIARRVDAVFVVVRLGHTRARRLKRLLAQLANAHVAAAGLVVVGADTGEYYR